MYHFCLRFFLSIFQHQIQLNLPTGSVWLSHFCHVWPLVTLWTVTCPAPLSMGFSRQEYWSGLPFSLKGDPGGIPEPQWPRDQTHVSCLLHWQPGSLPLVPPGKPPESITKVLVSQFVLGCFSCFSHVQLFLTLWPVAHQAPVSMGFSRQDYWCGFPCSPPGDLPYPEVKLESLMSPALEGRFSTTSTTWETPNSYSKFNS